MAMGPFRMGDLAGLDIGCRVAQAPRRRESPDKDYSNVADLLVRGGPLRPEDRRGLVPL